ncbi:MAG: molybdopterin-guanine dinucleotide biosynthesis protein B [Firmicutes bacterium]|nr:molybdopterin-guanine dinucleotide biosynthesis protein B [Bacillota bacterium]
MNISIGITAGGKSSRFGQDKRFILYKGRTLLENAILNFNSFDDLILSVDSISNISFSSNCLLNIVQDKEKSIGPIEAISQILSNSKYDNTFIFAVDMPLINKDFALFLSSYISSDFDVICPTLDGKINPLCAIYNKKILPIVEKQKINKNYKLHSLLQCVNTKYVDLSYTRFDRRIFSNCNTYEEYLKTIYPIVFAVSGYKKTGKTTLVESLIKKFCSEGYKVGAIKHDGHDYCIDYPGTDSYRLFEAGADVAIFSDKKITINKRGSEDLKNILTLFNQYDVIIIEGEKKSDIPKIQLKRENDEEFTNVFLSITGFDYDIEDIYLKVKEYFGIIPQNKIN